MHKPQLTRFIVLIEKKTSLFCTRSDLLLCIMSTVYLIMSKAITTDKPNERLLELNHESEGEMLNDSDMDPKYIVSQRYHYPKTQPPL